MTNTRIFERNGVRFLVRRTKCRHYEICLTLNGVKCSAWVRTTMKNLNKYYREVVIA